MSQRAEPHAHDLCAKHANEMTAPVGWEILRLTPAENDEFPAAPTSDDDLVAIAEAVNRPDPEPETTYPTGSIDRSVEPVHKSEGSTAPSPAGRRPGDVEPLGPAGGAVGPHHSGLRIVKS